MTFDPAAGISATSSVSDYAANSIGWLQGLRQQASTAADAKEALAQRSSEALSNATGVNVRRSTATADVGQAPQADRSAL